MSERELSRNDEWAVALRRLTTQTREFSVKRLSKASGIKATTLYKIRDNEHNPKWSEAKKLLQAIPNTTVNEIFRPIGIAVQATNGDRCDHTTLAMLCKTAAEFAEALEDGRVDHLEYGKMRPFVEGVRNLCDAWLAEENPTSKRVRHLGVINGDD